MANVFQDVHKNILSEEEEGWIEKIELLRAQLVKSPIEISIMDYGAGSPDSNLTYEEMYQGSIVTRTVGEVCQTNCKSQKWARLLFKLVREFKPSVCIELGTCLGISTAYLAAGLEINNNGKLITLEGAESLGSLAKDNLEYLGIDYRCKVVVGRFQDTLQSVLHENMPINFVFIDGHHDGTATKTYYRQISQYLSDGAVVVFDDINWSKGMESAWENIKNYTDIKISIDLSNIGVCIFSKSEVNKKHFKIDI